MKKSVIFKNNEIKMSGNLYLPEDFDENKKYPAIVVSHPGGGVKEQTAGLYAQKLSERGFVTLAFDASHQGESGGEPRFFENPTERVEDIKSAVDYFTTLPFIDVERIGALGICAGGGYTISAAQTEKRIKAIVGVSSADLGLTFRGGWHNEVGVEEQLKTLEAVAKQRTAEASGAEPMYVPLIPNDPTEITDPDYKEFYDYYRTKRGEHPNSVNKLRFTSFDRIFAFDAFAQIETLLSQPMLLIAGSKAGSKWQSEKAYNLAKSPKELFIVEGATHTDLYDKPQYVDPNVDKMSEFFNEYLI